MNVSLLTRGKARELIPVLLRRSLKRQFERALRSASLSESEVCLSLSDDEELRQLNQHYAGEDHSTDVLSFSQSEETPHTDEFKLLGDIIISAETATRQADAASHPLLKELLHLSVHGLCHLMGYDHRTKEEEKIMFGYEEKLREQALGVGRVRLIPPPAKAE